VLVLHATSIFGLQTGGVSSGLAAFVALVIGTSLTLLGLGLVQAATARALVELDRGANVSALGAYRLALRQRGATLRRVVGRGAGRVAARVDVLPASDRDLARGPLGARRPVVELEEASALDALRRSRELVRGRWLKVASLIVAGGAVVLALGPLLGALLFS
jgi:hypothetical protein